MSLVIVRKIEGMTPNRPPLFIVENYHAGNWVAVHDVELPHAGFPVKVKAIQAPNWILAVDFEGEPVLIDLRRVSLVKVRSEYARKFKEVWEASTAKRAQLECEDPHPPVSIPGAMQASYIPPPPPPDGLPYESP